MANSDIDINSPHYKGEFSSIYEVNRKFPTGGVAGDFVVIEGWAHYWNADRATWCVNAERDSYWDELVTNILEKFKLFRGATYMGVAGLDTVPEKASGVKMYYFAIVPGTYTNFGNLVVPQGINVLYSENGKSWVCSSLLEVTQEVGESEWKVVSQNLLKKTQDLINAELAKKANAADVASKFTEESSRVNVELAKKANAEEVASKFTEEATRVDAELAKKANAADVASKFTEESSRVNVELAKKANAEEVASKFTEEATRVDAELAKKANAKDVEQSFSEQTAKNTEQDAEIAKKANAADVATKADVAKTNAEQDKEISRKANQQDVERSLNILRKEIGERTVVEGNVNNHPDEEDLTSKMGSNNRAVLSLKDREYNPLEFSGKGYKILRKNIQKVTCAITKIQVTKAPTTDGYVSIIINGVETHVDLVASTDNTVALVAKKIADKLSETMEEYVTSIDGALVTCTRIFGGDVTSSSFSGVNTGSEATVGESSKTELRNLITAAMLSEANIIYEIRYDFDLNGETIELKEGCTLKFEGGSLNNGKIIFNGTFIDTKEILIFKDISISGTLKNTNIKFDWFSNKDITTINEILEIRYSSIPDIYINGTIIADEPIKINRPVNIYCDNFEFHQSIWGYPGVIINSSDVAIYGNISVFSDVAERTAITNTYFPNIVDKKASSSAICLGSLSESKQIGNIHIEKCYLHNFIAGILSHGSYAGDWGVKNVEINYCYIENIDFGIFGASWYGLFINMLEFKNIASYINSEDPSHVVYITGDGNEITSENIIINNLIGTGCISKKEDSVLSLKSCASFRCLNSMVNNIGYFAAVLNSKCELSDIYIDNAYGIIGVQLEGTICNVRNVIARNVKAYAFSCSTNATLKVADCDIEYTGENMTSNKCANYISDGVAEFSNFKIKAPDNSTAQLFFYNSSDVNGKLTIYNPITNMDILGLGSNAKINNIKVYLNPSNVDTKKIVKTDSLLRLSIILLENNEGIKTVESDYINEFLVSKIVEAKVSTISRIYAPKNQILILKNGGNCTLNDSEDIILKQANVYKANSWNTLVFISTGPNSIEELFCDYHPSGSFNDKPKPKRIGLQYFNTDTNKMITWNGFKWWNPDGTEATS